MKNKITIEKLDNGLTIYLKEIHSAPIISHWVWYRVGARNEQAGFTGISHWVEHMQFKGTQRFSGNLMDRVIAREGGLWNAFTHLDWTTYYETMPANKIDIALELEADRMFNSIYDPIEVDYERKVILSEKEGKENDPFSRLNNAVINVGFEKHPYRNEVIGTSEDLNRIQRDDLYQHYRRFYQPANAVIAIAGDFDSIAMVKKINNLYGEFPSRPIITPEAEPELMIRQKKEVLLRGPGDTTFVQLAYRAPSASNPDFYAYTILDSLLTGPASLNMFGGGGTSNKTSRLYQKLVEKELALNIFGGLQATIDPFVYEIVMTLHPDKKPETLINALDNEIDRILNKRIRRREIDRAVKQARALFAYGLENITNQAFWLGYAEMFSDYDWFVQYLDRLSEIKPADVRKIAQKYFNPENRIIGLYIPDNGQGDGS